ncbi:MAG: hypothetical protein GF384_00810 [Elusimicrobia bacterium]|nr:hypothetical protein [Elusimicrobiota bacterium]
MFIISPLAGYIFNILDYESSSSLTDFSIVDKGPLYGLYFSYMQKGFIFGGLHHDARLEHSEVTGNLLYVHYYFNHKKRIQPTVGINLEKILIYSKVNRSGPYTSVNIRNNIIAVNPVCGITTKWDYMKMGTTIFVTPFMGYFQERVNTGIISPGMAVNGQLLNGFESNELNRLDFTVLGVKIRVHYMPYILLKSKIYFRLKHDQKTLYTLRNELSVYMRQNIGIMLKYDYFLDTYNTNRFYFIGPLFIF